MIRLEGTRRGLAATTDCNGRFCWLNPREGAKAAVAEAARNLVCTGATPSAVTNNLNFGSPLRPNIYHQMREAVLGMAEACSLFETPVTGGNVSLFNETDGRAVYPTPVIGMVGIVHDLEKVVTVPFRRPGDVILVLGETREEIGGSEYLYRVHDRVAGEAPVVDLMAERRLQHAMLALVEQEVLSSAHDCAEGGLAAALAESAVSGEEALGVDVELHDRIAPVAALFGESHGRVVVSAAPEDEDRVLETARSHGVPARRVGTVGQPDGRFRIRCPGGEVATDIRRVAHIYHRTLPDLMSGTTTPFPDDPDGADGPSTDPTPEAS
ncbi:MAG: hypothetical protein EA352_11935 [Gemmatimonadales bacterium]|nr:MAG: hypothetical protein EA352_11935 [Gemmatimonadales bacterium]